MSTKPNVLTQEKIENFFYKVIEELRNDNIPILNNFCENFANIKYEKDIINTKELETENSDQEYEDYHEDEK